jgi:ABC-type glycerol-3-phosphate transport system permease component
MKVETKKRGLVGLWLLAALLMTTAALRDIFAPGFLSMSGLVMSRTYIAVEFVLAAAAMAYAFWLSRGHFPKSN